MKIPSLHSYETRISRDWAILIHIIGTSPIQRNTDGYGYKDYGPADYRNSRKQNGAPYNIYVAIGKDSETEDRAPRLDLVQRDKGKAGLKMGIDLVTSPLL